MKFFSLFSSSKEKTDKKESKLYLFNLVYPELNFSTSNDGLLYTPNKLNFNTENKNNLNKKNFESKNLIKEENIQKIKLGKISKIYNIRLIWYFK
jgi:hypothetical protein